MLQYCEVAAVSLVQNFQYEQTTELVQIQLKSFRNIL